MKSFFQFLNEAQSQASMQAKKLNLVSDGHGGWLDSRGKFVATTEDGKLKFVDKKKAKGQEEPTTKPKAAQAEPKAKSKQTAPKETGAATAKAGEGDKTGAETSEVLTIAFGRFNPPTVGHGKLLSAAKKASQGGDLKIYPSRSQDPKKNPLDPDMKISFMKKMSACVDCHMPSQLYMGVDARRDHSMRIPRPDLSMSTGAPNACNQCHTDQSADWAYSALMEWGVRFADRRNHPARAFHTAGRGDVRAAPVLLETANNENKTAMLRASAITQLGRLSNRQIPVATDTFKLSTVPAIGNLTKKSQFSRVKRRIPSPSAPMTKHSGPVRS